LILWNLQILYFHNNYSWIVALILGAGLPSIILFQCNKFYQDVQVNFLALAGYYLLMLFCLNIAFYISSLFYIFCALMLGWYLIDRKKILNGEDEETIELGFYSVSIFDRDPIHAGSIRAMAYASVFIPFATNERHFHPVPLLLFAMSIIFVNEYLLLLMKQKVEGSKLTQKLADVFS